MDPKVSSSCAGEEREWKNTDENKREALILRLNNSSGKQQLTFKTVIGVPSN